MHSRVALAALGLLLGCAPKPPCEVYVDAAGACFAAWGIEAEPACDPESEVSEEYLLCVAEVYDEADCTAPDAFVAVREALSACALLILEEA